MHLQIHHFLNNTAINKYTIIFCFVAEAKEECASNPSTTHKVTSEGHATAGTKISKLEHVAEALHFASLAILSLFLIEVNILCTKFSPLSKPLVSGLYMIVIIYETYIIARVFVS